MNGKPLASLSTQSLERRESSRDDINSECEQQFEYEQRFRVDRRKLELMMMNSPEFGEVAAEFFERIGAETNTCVIWPSRLKVAPRARRIPTSELVDVKR